MIKFDYSAETSQTFFFFLFVLKCHLKCLQLINYITEIPYFPFTLQHLQPPPKKARSTKNRSSFFFLWLTLIIKIKKKKWRNAVQCTAETRRENLFFMKREHRKKEKPFKKIFAPFPRDFIQNDSSSCVCCLWRRNLFTSLHCLLPVFDR